MVEGGRRKSWGGGVRGGMHGTFTVGAEEVVEVEDGMVEVGEGAVARLR